MPVSLTYPGVYIEEVPSGVRTITGVATSITAFLGRALRGPVNEPTRIQSFAEYERAFGGLSSDSTMSYSVQHFFLNGGSDALIVRIVNSATAASAIVDRDGLELEAANDGEWGNRLRAVVDHVTADPANTDLFNLTIQELESTDPTSDVIASEIFRNVSISSTSTRFVQNVLANQSTFARVTTVPVARPGIGQDMFAGGADGNALAAADYQGSAAGRTGLFALDKADLVNLMCIPPATPGTDMDVAVYTDALAYCKDRRAMLIVDPRTDVYKRQARARCTDKT